MSEPSDERYTPEHVLEVVRQFGVISVDPCTTADNRTGAQAWMFLPERNGLDLPWEIPMSELAYVNPPYSRGELAKWVRKIVYESGGDAHIVALIPSDLGTDAGQIVAQTADAICFVKGRLKFGTPDGTATLETGAKQPSIMPYWGKETKRFARIFAQLGVVWVR